MNYTETRLGISIGDFCGISPEILFKAFESNLMYKHCTPVVFAHEKLLLELADLYSVSKPELNVVDNWDDVRKDCINVFEPEGKFDNLTVGTPNPESGRYAISSLKSAIDAILNGHVHNIVTLPIDKHNSFGEDFPFEGHTDYLGARFETEDYMMLLVSDEMKIGMVTGHVPISKVSSSITSEKVEHKIKVLMNCLQQDFAIRKPKIAVLGLNPHSGDQGLIGSEEQEIISPVIKKFIDDGDLVYGPFPADGFFGNKLYQQYDAVLAMYHDQGLIPFKQLSFSDGVNYTAGLPVVRTSPDHGTAFDIAGKGLANAESLINSIFLTKRIYNNRIEFLKLNGNPLGFTRHRREKFSIGVPNLK